MCIGYALNVFILIFLNSTMLTIELISVAQKTKNTTEHRSHLRHLRLILFIDLELTRDVDLNVGRLL